MYALRQLWRQYQADKLFSLINVGGLTLSISCFLLILTYVGYHYSFDRFHADSERIYRLLGVDINNPEAPPGGQVTNALIPAIRAEIPEVEIATRIQPTLGLVVHTDDRVHYLDIAYFADSDFFRLFNFPMASGIGGEALDEPNTIIVSESFAQRLFGTQDPIGKTLTLFDTRDMRIVGVMRDMPSNSHLQVDAVMSLRPDPSWPTDRPSYLDSWLSVFMNAYIKLTPGSDPAAVQQKIQQIMTEHEESGYFSVLMQPLPDVHLHSSDVIFDFGQVKEDIRNVYILVSIALLLLAIAICNYINLATARSVARAREIGIRKAIGANRLQLVKQFLTESVCLMLLSCVLSLLIVDVLSSWITVASIESPFFYLLSHPGASAIAFGVLALTTLIAGLYPALVMSSQKAVRAMRGNCARSRYGNLIRRSLVVFQFTMSTTVIIWLLAINTQISFMQSLSLGFNPDNVIVIDLRDRAMHTSYQAFMDVAKGIPEIESMTNTSFAPADGGWGRTGFVSLPASTETTETMMNLAEVDASFIPTLQMHLTHGENFNDDLSPGDLTPVVVNEAALRVFQWADTPINKIISSTSGREHIVVGVFEDIRLDSLANAVEPLVLRQSQEIQFSLAIRFSPNTMATGLTKLEDTWRQFYPAYPFEYRTLTNGVAGLVGEEVEFASQLLQFAVIAILIACLGIYGHATFSANQKAKYIGIHKVLGASVGDIFKFICREYGLLLLLANIIAWPAGYLLVELWLSSFAERFEPGVSIYLLSMLIVMAVASVTVAAKVWEVVRTNPIEVLRDE